MKWILILWLSTDVALDSKPSEQGGLTTATFEDEEVCMASSGFVAQQSSNRVRGV